MSVFGECKGYMNKPCPKCGRYRLEYYENGQEICEKCEWCEQLKEYIPIDDERYFEEGYISNCWKPFIKDGEQE